MSSPTQDDLLFKALADARRREILDLLKRAPRTTGDLCAHFEPALHRCTVMQHLGVLERAGLVLALREGRTRWNYLNAEPFQEIYERWISSYAKPAVELLSRLKQDLEGESAGGPPASDRPSSPAGRTKRIEHRA